MFDSSGGRHDPAGGPGASPSADRPLRIDLASQQVRRRQGLLLCAVIGGVGVLAVAVGLLQLI